MKAGAVILAAGGATRFGGPKQLLEIDDETLIDRACHTALAAGCDPVLRVLGARADEILNCPPLPDVSTWVHEGWQEGMGGSLAAGVRHLLEMDPQCGAVFVLLADQPQVPSVLLEQMSAMLESGVSIVICDYGGGTGPPALFGRHHFSELMALSGDRGARTLVPKHPGSVARIPFPGGACDIDSREDWERFLMERKPRITTHADTTTRVPD